MDRDKIIGQKRNVLTHGFIELTNYMNGDYEVYRNAKASTGAPKDDIEDQKRLIDFLVQNNHSSPLEFIEIEWHVKCPIYVARQWVRHRMSEMNEYSGRYRKILSDFEPINDLENLTEAEKMKYVELMSESYDFYEKVVNRVSEKFPGKENTNIRGRIREKMRGVLGTGYYTEYFWKCNLHSLANFLKKRFDGGQPEIVVYAENMLEMARPIAPICFDAIEKHWLRKESK
jgi:thymidylate synthase (FAD)